MAAVWRDLPDFVGALLWVPFVSSLAFGAILFTFFAAFPRPLFRKRWMWAVCWAPMVWVVASFLPEQASLVYRPQLAAAAPRTFLLMIMTASYSAAGLIALAVNYRRLDDVNDRRRVRVIIPGSVIGVVSGFVLIISYWVRSPGNVAGPVYGSPTMVIGGLVLLALPLSFAYAILRRRMFDLSTLVRQGIRYALARRVVLLVVPLLIAILVLDLALQRERSLSETVAAHLGAYVVLIAIAIYASWRRERWLAGLDRRFFRDRYDAHRLVRQVTARLRDSGTIDSVAPYVVAQIETALHPKVAALMLRSPSDTSFRTLASAPAGSAPVPLAGASRLMALVRVLGGPLRLGPDHDGGLTHQLPHEEREFVRNANVDLIFPVTLSADRDELVLVLGSKRSEEPYEDEDLDLLAGVADALALVVERPRQAVPPGSRLEECPTCGRCYDSGTGRCTEEQAVLQPVPTARLLAQRYRLDRRLDRGGMGTVYEARDVALERTVAVKLLREDWVRFASGADRFRREALIAASFAHPNVVTVFDFGLAEENRAFLVMERLEGWSAREESRRAGSLPPWRVVEILRGVCAAVEVAHRRGLIHRDLKPENVFVATVESIETVKVLDFGLAKSVSSVGDDSASHGILLGTLPYMAPEQLRNEPAQPAWDIWALGVLSYELLTGALPFATAGDATTTGSSAIWPEPIGARLTGSLVPFQRFFARALAVDPRARPATAQEFLVAFEDAVHASEGLALTGS
jgi:tRNA A-37 threonylcarbamoyl transferase component Bud32